MGRKEIENIKVRLRSTFGTPLGRWSLGFILDELCKFSLPASTEEIAVRQAVGRELLSIMDMWFGGVQTTTPEKFINKLMTDEETRRKRE